MVVKMIKKTVHIDKDSHEIISKRAKDNNTTIEQETNQIIQKELIMSELELESNWEIVIHNSTKSFENKVNTILRNHPGSEPFKNKGLSNTEVRSGDKWYILIGGLQEKGEVIKQIKTIHGTKDQVERESNRLEKEKPNIKFLGTSIDSQSKIYMIFVYDAFKTIPGEK